MLQNCLQFLFIFIICIIIPVNCGLLEENITTEEERLSDHVPGEICQSKFCSCSDFFKLGNVSCESSGKNDIHKLAFHDSNRALYLGKEMFFGLNISALILNMASITVSEKFLEGIIALSAFKVEQSDIGVM